MSTLTLTTVLLSTRSKDTTINIINKGEAIHCGSEASSSLLS